MIGSNDGRKSSKMSDSSSDSRGCMKKTNPSNENGEISNYNTCCLIYHWTKRISVIDMKILLY